MMILPPIMGSVFILMMMLTAMIAYIARFLYRRWFNT
jgi:hypothetical protein